MSRRLRLLRQLAAVAIALVLVMVLTCLGIAVATGGLSPPAVLTAIAIVAVAGIGGYTWGVPKRFNSATAVARGRPSYSASSGQSGHTESVRGVTLPGGRLGRVRGLTGRFMATAA